MVRFAPESLGGYEDFITVETQGEEVLVVPIRAERHPPVLTRESDLRPGVWTHLDGFDAPSQSSSWLLPLLAQCPG